ncbi:MAG: hypothetical protein AAF250_04155 [Pseudomonadota bacterium]
MAQVTDKEIDMGLRSLARIIKRYGPAYWPLFDRLNREVTERREREELLKKVTLGDLQDAISLSEFLRQREQ